MSEKFKNKYRIQSFRLQNWDYGWDGAYFITICTKNREYFFGDVVNDEMILSHAGLIAEIMWYEIKNHAENIELGAYQIMPNHIHGILILDGNRKEWEFDGNFEEKTIGQRRFQNQGKNTISSICGGYKSAVTKHCNRLGIENGWQAKFHDHVIRGQHEYETISNYIVNNPKKWKDDKFYG